MSFKTKGYDVKRKVISKEISDLCREYLLLRREAAYHLYESKYIMPQTNFVGSWNDEQVPNTWSIYGDALMEVLLGLIKPKMEKWTGQKLIETYAYTRIYKKGDILDRHKDRPECEISTTLNLGTDSWPIFIEPDKNKGRFIETKRGKIYETQNTKGKKIDLKPGDMLLYRGQDLEHWREAFEGDVCAQVFLHYSPDTDKNKKLKFDGRPCRGLPKYFPRRPWLKQ